MQEKIRKAIIGSFEKPEKHPTAKELLVKVKKQLKDVTSEGLEAALSHLEKNGQIYSVVSSDSLKHFGLKKGMHCHFICDECGMVRDFFMSEGAIDMIRDHAQKLLNSTAKVKKTNMSFQGVCHECLKK